MTAIEEFVNEAHARLRALTDERSTVQITEMTTRTFGGGESREESTWNISLSACVFVEGGKTQFVCGVGFDSSLRKAVDICESEFRTKVAALYAEPAVAA